MILWLIFVFFEITIAVGIFGVMGSFGAHFSTGNFKLFGALALLYPLGLIYLAYRFYRCKKFSLREIEITLASVLLFLLLLILQFVLFSKGVVGEAIVVKLKPYIGIFGVSVGALLGVFVCVLTLKNEDITVWFKRLDTTRLTLFIKSCFKVFISMFLQKIFFPLALRVRKSYQNITAPKEKLSIPSIELEMSDEESAKPHLNVPLALEMHTEEIIMDDLKDLPIYRDQEKKEEILFDDDIEIQEYIVPLSSERKQSNIKVLNDAPSPQPKENPFSYDELIKHRSSSISSSVQLREKIKEKSANKENKPKEEMKKITPKVMPRPLQNNPLSSLANTQKKSELQADSQEDLEEVFELPLWERELEDENLKMQETIDVMDSQIEATQEKEVGESILEPQEVQESIQEQSVKEIKEENIQDTPQVFSAPKQYANEFEITPTRSRTTHSKVSSLAENEALLQSIDKGKLEAPKDYKLPPISLLASAPEQRSNEVDEGEIDEKISSLLEKLSVFKIDGDVERTYSGPIITTLEFRPAPNVKVSRIQSLENDIAMALEAKSIRIQAPIPGKSVVGIEIPNSTVETIYLREIFESEIFKNSASPLTLALGKDVVGNPFVTDLKKLPHLLIAGTTGSGKSVGVNAMILSLLYRNSPDDLKLMMVDPKMVEFMPYTDLPHLITPIITDPKKAVIGLANAVREMERRYMLMSQSRTKEIVSYNQKAQELGLEKFPYFVIIIDELADLMMTAGKEVEYSMARIAQMGRASGMHLIVATQSPRAEVLTGLIKTNLPAHLSYKVGTKIDAGIIGCAGAETLLGRGDLLFTPPGVSGLVRLHAPWSSEDEVNHIVSYIKDQREVMYNPLFSPEERESLGAMDATELDSESARLVEEAKKIILQDGKTSISYIQRRLGIGYNKAADIVEKLEQMGFLSAPNSKGVREILG